MPVIALSYLHLMGMGPQYMNVKLVPKIMVNPNSWLW